MAQATPGQAIAPSEMVDGREDQRRQRHDDEQGPRDHRGPSSVRPARDRPSTSWSIRSRSCTAWSPSSDGSVLAQLGEPDMRIPDRLHPGLACAARHRRSGTRPLRPLGTGVRAAGPGALPGAAARAATPCGRVGRPLLYSTPPTRSAVAAFLDGRIGFLDIARTVERVLERAGTGPCDDLETVLAQDALARRLAARDICRPRADARDRMKEVLRSCSAP